MFLQAGKSAAVSTKAVTKKTEHEKNMCIGDCCIDLR
jgi:hypothetical protein